MVGQGQSSPQGSRSLGLCVYKLGHLPPGLPQPRYSGSSVHLATVTSPSAVVSASRALTYQCGAPLGLHSACPALCGVGNQDRTRTKGASIFVSPETAPYTCCWVC